jgi:plasmid stabilization system protein ParE
MVSVEWSALAERQLNEIYQYYSFNVSPAIANKVVNRIVKRVEILFKNPLSGAKEELLSDYPEDFRYLVVTNYKIIYWYDDQVITIALVFDCRQNPEKMKFK